LVTTDNIPTLAHIIFPSHELTVRLPLLSITLYIDINAFNTLLGVVIKIISLSTVGY